MAEPRRNTVNLLDLYRDSFGYIGVPWPNASVKSYIPNQETIDNLKAGLNGKSILGTPIFMPTTIDGFDLPNTPIVDIRGSKTIIETKIDNADGEFKEGFSLDSYEVTIKGICIDEEEPDVYPEQQVRELRRLFERKTHLLASNDLLTYFGIEYLVIYDIDIPGESGAESYQPYTLKCKSDKVFDLEISESDLAVGGAVA